MVVEPGDRAAERAFLSLPRRLYRNDPHFIAEAPRRVRGALADPDYASRQAAFLVQESGAVLGRCVARESALAGTGTIGYFECDNRPAACACLLGAAEAWLRSRGAARVLGPMDGDTWHRYRFVADPGDSAPFLKEPWNPGYYTALWEASGYTVVDRYLSSRITDVHRAAQELAPFLRRVQRQGYTLRELNRQRLADELEVLYRLSLRIFEGNRHYTPIGREGFLRLYEGIERLILPPLCQFGCAPDGTEVGFVFAYPDYADALRAMRGRRNPLAILRFLRARRRARRVCIKSLGCLPDYRGTGMGPALMARAFEQTAACGYEEALMCLMHDSNDSRRLDGGVSEPFRHYVLYRKEL